ncbi:Slx4p interacting protein [Vermiconidia calcicola]|uniref:Slx4p interacting protein n=1 Tax=Vermiconidia calcicola TaxID=1690605 RepID=A0ACC3MW29_9PEZI|nr:Slx4p interacting protein [Vermiconidia calcicola]
MGMAKHSSNTPYLPKLTFDAVPDNCTLLAQDWTFAQAYGATAFERWPLQLTFYSQDVFKVWQKWTAQHVERLRPGIEVGMDESVLNSTFTIEPMAENTTGIYALDVGYSGLKAHLEKSKVVLGAAIPPKCTFCHDDLPQGGVMSIVCPTHDCGTSGHLECFATHFLETNGDSLVPTTGTCPACGTKMQWIDLVKESSLRMRGEKEVEKLFRVRKPRRTKKQDHVATIPDENDEESAEEDEDAMNDEWHYLSDDSIAEPDRQVVRSDPSPFTKASNHASSAFRIHSEPVIEDSDWDEAELIT